MPAVSRSPFLVCSAVSPMVCGVRKVVMVGRVDTFYSLARLTAVDTSVQDHYDVTVSHLSRVLTLVEIHGRLQV